MAGGTAKVECDIEIWKKFTALLIFVGFRLLGGFIVQII